MRVFRAAVAMLAGLGALLLASAAAQAADYQHYRDGACPTGGGCAINFPVVPAGKTVRIDNFSCYLRIPTGLSVGALQLVVVNANGSRAFATTPNLAFQSIVKIGATTQQVHTSNDTIRAVARPTQVFRAYVNAYDGNGTLGRVLQFSCGISGTVV